MRNPLRKNSKKNLDFPLPAVVVSGKTGKGVDVLGAERVVELFREKVRKRFEEELTKIMLMEEWQKTEILRRFDFAMNAGMLDALIEDMKERRQE